MATTRLLVVSDIHFPTDPRAVWKLAGVLRHSVIDALVLAGDFLDDVSANAVQKLFFRVLRRAYKGPIIVVWGNHEHYLTRNRLERGLTSIDQLDWLYDRLIEHGVKVLDRDGPVNIGSVTIAGVVGWYDYSYGPREYTSEDYERCNPYGVSLEVIRKCARGRWRHLCPPWWRNDCLYVKLPMDNRTYLKLNAERFVSQLERAEPPIVAVLHHVPRRELLRYTGNPVKDFDLAYAGSPVLGSTLEKHMAKLAAVVYGHVHEHSIARVLPIHDTPYVNAYHAFPQSSGFVLINIESNNVSFRTKIEIQ